MALIKGFSLKRIVNKFLKPPNTHSFLTFDQPDQ